MWKPVTSSYQTTGKRIAPQHSRSTRNRISIHNPYSLEPSSVDSIMMYATFARTWNQILLYTTATFVHLTLAYLGSEQHIHTVPNHCSSYDVTEYNTVFNNIFKQGMHIWFALAFTIDTTIDQT